MDPAWFRNVAKRNTLLTGVVSATLFLDRRILIGNITNRRWRKNEREKFCFLNGEENLMGRWGGVASFYPYFYFPHQFCWQMVTLMNCGLCCDVDPSFNFFHFSAFLEDTP